MTRILRPAKRRADTMRRHPSALLPVLVASALLAGCTTSALELEDRGNDPIPRRLLGEMRDLGTAADAPVLVRIFKKESELEVWKRTASGTYALLKTYPMCRWSGRLGRKTREGDRQAPEGFYEVSLGRLNPRSQFHLSFDLGYPNRLERALGYTGSNLMVHGACSSSGCFAISDESMGEVYAVVRDALRGGQRAVQVQSYPFRMTAANMLAHRSDPNHPFWTNLKEGYDAFETRRRPPKVEACGGTYAFDAQFATPPSSDPRAPCPARLDAPSGSTGDAGPLVADGSRSAGTFAYADGGMHPSFRELLARHGAERLSRMTSGNGTPVSRPAAALADPHR